MQNSLLLLHQRRQIAASATLWLRQVTPEKDPTKLALSNEHEFHFLRLLFQLYILLEQARANKRRQEEAYYKTGKIKQFENLLYFNPAFIMQLNFTQKCKTFFNPSLTQEVCYTHICTSKSFERHIINKHFKSLINFQQNIITSGMEIIFIRAREWQQLVHLSCPCN